MPIDRLSRYFLRSMKNLKNLIEFEIWYFDYFIKNSMIVCNSILFKKKYVTIDEDLCIF